MCLKSPKLGTLTQIEIKVEHLVSFVVQIGHLEVHIGFEIIHRLIVNILIGMTYTYRGIWGIFSMDCNIVSDHSPQVAILGRCTEANLIMLL